MSERVIEGLWDCPYCNSKGIGGLSKHCPECGHPQDKGTKFYVGKKKRYLSDDEVDKVGNAPDWVCDYCAGLNNAKYIYCRNCGAARGKGTKDYFTSKETADTVNKTIPSSQTEKRHYDFSEDFTEDFVEKDTAIVETEDTGIVGSENASTVERAAKSNVTRLVQCAKRSLPALGRIIVPIFVIGIIFIGILALFYPKYVDATVSEKSWEREIEIEEYRTVKENGWSIPSGGRLLYSQSEIRSYETVLDHYETKTRTVTEQVFDGYDTNTYYTDNGNGTFTEHTSQTPRYRTETKLETYEEPVYKQVPVYDTKYYYEIERWIYDRTETSAATDENPYWAEYVLDDNERVSDKKESYDVVFIDDEGKEYTYSCEYGEWTGYELAEEVELKLSAGIVLEVTSKDNIIDVN